MLMEQALLRPRRRLRRPLALLCMVSLLLLCVGWSALWLFARHEAGNAMDGWFASEAGRGRQWTCPARTITGFPFALRVACSAPSFQGRVGGETLDVSAAGLVVSVYLHAPDAIHASVETPITFARTGQDQPATLTASALTVEARQLTGGLARFEVQIETPSLEDGGVTGGAAHAELHVTPVAGAVRDDSYRLAFSLDQARVPALDEAIHNADPLKIEGNAVLTHAVAASGEPWQRLVERWRAAGGICDLSSLELTKGEMRARIEGVLALDEAHRVTAPLKAQVSGALLAKALDMTSAKISLPFGMSMLLKAALSRSLADARMLDLDVSLSDGRATLSVIHGPLPLGPIAIPQRLAPLY